MGKESPVKYLLYISKASFHFACIFVILDWSVAIVIRHNKIELNFVFLGFVRDWILLFEIFSEFCAAYLLSYALYYSTYNINIMDTELQLLVTLLIPGYCRTPRQRVDQFHSATINMIKVLNCGVVQGLVLKYFMWTDF
jgi:hypothetical protein